MCGVTKKKSMGTMRDGSTLLRIDRLTGWGVKGVDLVLVHYHHDEGSVLNNVEKNRGKKFDSQTTQIVLETTKQTIEIYMVTAN